MGKEARGLPQVLFLRSHPHWEVGPSDSARLPKGPACLCLPSARGGESIWVTLGTFYNELQLMHSASTPKCESWVRPFPMAEE